VTLRRIINQSNDKDQDSLSAEKTLTNNEGNCNQTVADSDLELKGRREELVLFYLPSRLSSSFISRK